MEKAKVKRIFISGSGGSFWSGIDRWLRYALFDVIDNSDINENRNHDGHVGAYWNPGNEPSWDWILNFAEYDRDHIIKTLDSAYSKPIPDISEKNYIVRTHKSHFWSLHYDKLVQLFPEDDIIAVNTAPHMAFVWWQICGGHDTLFNDYKHYRRDYTALWEDLCKQINLTNQFIEKYQLEKQFFNRTFIEKYFQTPHPMFDRRTEDFIRHPDKIDSLLGQSCPGTRLVDKSQVVIKLGSYRPFNK